MSVQERRQHYRIDDQVYFNYRVMVSGDPIKEHCIIDELLGKNGKKFIETASYFNDLDYELSELTQSLALNNPSLAHYLNILNAKIDHLTNHLMLGEKIQMKKVNLSLGGMAFKTGESIDVGTPLKLVIYTKPKMIPVILNAFVVHSERIQDTHYRIAIQFESLTSEQEMLLSQHIMMAQLKNKPV